MNSVSDKIASSLVIWILLLACQKVSVKFDGKEYQISKKAIELNDQGVIAMRNPDSLDYAIDFLNQAIQTDSDYHLAYINKYNIERKFKKYDFGTRTMQAFVKRFPNNPSGYLMLGFGQERNGDSREAMITYQTALNLQTDYFLEKGVDIDSVKHGLFILTYLLGDSISATAQFEKYKQNYDTLGNYKRYTLKEFIDQIRQIEGK
jgi:tetratricopeptide (TPR) repeat protein